MPPVHLMSFSIENGDDQIANSIISAIRSILPIVDLNTIQHLRMRNDGGGLYRLTADITLDQWDRRGEFCLELLSIVQYCLVIRVSALGWPVKQNCYGPRRPKAPAADLLVHSYLRKLRSEVRDGTVIRFQDAAGFARFSVRVGGEFSPCHTNTRAQAHGQVLRIKTTKNYRVLYLNDIQLGSRAMILPSRIAKPPKTGSFVFAEMSPLRDSRYSWQLEHYIQIQGQLF